MRKLPAALVLLLLPISVGAQSNLEGGYGQAQDILKRCRPAGPRVQPAKPDPRLQAGLVAAAARRQMQDAVGAGSRLMDTLDQAGAAVQIETTLGELCLLHDREIYPRTYKPEIMCDPALGSASPRYAALLIAERAAELRWRPMPDCAEKEFIVASLMSRSWLEVGGDRSRLPLFDGLKDEARAGRIKRWLSQKLPDYVRDERAKGRPGLEDRLRSNAQAQGGALKAIQDLEARFKSATCESEEQGLLREIYDQKALLKALELEEANQKRFLEQAKAFAQEEGEWAQRNWRLLR